MEAQKVPWVTSHIMRHTFASLLASAGVSMLVPSFCEAETFARVVPASSWTSRTVRTRDSIFAIVARENSPTAILQLARKYDLRPTTPIPQLPHLRSYDIAVRIAFALRRH